MGESDGVAVGDPKLNSREDGNNWFSVSNSTLKEVSPVPTVVLPIAVPVSQLSIMVSPIAVPVSHLFIMQGHWALASASWG